MPEKIKHTFSVPKEALPECMGGPKDIPKKEENDKHKKLLRFTALYLSKKNNISIEEALKVIDKKVCFYDDYCGTEQIWIDENGENEEVIELSDIIEVFGKEENK